VTDVEIRSLTSAVERRFCSVPVHLCSLYVRDEVRGVVAWEGNVELFQLTGHKEARECYAWPIRGTRGKPEYAMVLRVPPIATAFHALQAQSMLEAMKL
jgi:hypothetical protein